MSTTDEADERAGHEPGVLARLSTEMVRLHKQYWGRGPESAKAYAIDDLVLVVMRGGLTVAERTMLDAGRQDSVRATRQEFQNDKTALMCGTVEELIGREVLTYQSQILFEPDMVIEVFVLEDDAGRPPRGTAREQLRAVPTKGVLGADVDDPPAEGADGSGVRSTHGHPTDSRDCAVMEGAATVVLRPPTASPSEGSAEPVATTRPATVVAAGTSRCAAP